MGFSTIVLSFEESSRTKKIMALAFFAHHACKSWLTELIVRHLLKDRAGLPYLIHYFTEFRNSDLIYKAS